MVPASPDESLALDKIAAAFQKISGLDFEIDAWELQGILNAGFKKGTQFAIIYFHNFYHLLIFLQLFLVSKCVFLKLFQNECISCPSYFALRQILCMLHSLGIKVGDFSLDTCRSMIALHDMSRSGKLDFEEFKELWNHIRLWKAVFIEHDKDKCGEMNSFELREALNEAGSHLKLAQN